MSVFKKDSEEPKSPSVQPYNVLRPITASAAKISTSDKNEVDALKKRKSSQSWQEDAWAYFDAIGEIKYAFNLFSNVLSRIRVHAAYIENDQDSPTPIQKSPASEHAKSEADKAMRRVFGGGKSAEVLRKTGINLLVVGECYLINDVTYVDGMKRDNWKIVSTDELVAVSDGFALKTRSDQKPGDMTPIKSGTFMGRMWRQHPRYSDEPDSSMKALCGICNDLLLLSRTVRATARSRLNAGAFFVPEEFSVSQDNTTDEIDDDDLDPYYSEESDEFEDQLIDSMSTPIHDEDSASAVVPLLIRGPAEAGKELRHIKFERVFDPQLTNRADRALERILQGIDMPKEMITGLSNIKYSNAIQINESFYTAHIEPLVLMICDVFRTMYLEPTLRLAGVDQDEIDNIVIWYDPSGITTAPDKSAAANVGFDKMALSGDAWRRSNGFTEDDKPSPEELANRLAMTRGQLTPEITETIFRALFPDVMNQTRENSIADSPVPPPDSLNEILDGSAQSPPTDPTDSPPVLAEPTDTEGEYQPLEDIADGE